MNGFSENQYLTSQAVYNLQSVSLFTGDGFEGQERWRLEDRGDEATYYGTNCHRTRIENEKNVHTYSSMYNKETVA